jgi:cytochrome c2
MGAVLAAGLSGCLNMAQIAPPVTPELAATGGLHASLEDLGNGRKLFVTRCTACHAIPRPAKESAGEWPPVLDRMSKRARLDSRQREQVLAYILAVRK